MASNVTSYPTAVPAGNGERGLPALTGTPLPALPAYRGVPLTGMDDSLRMAKVIVASGTAPKSLISGNADPIAAVWTAIQLGAEIGLPPMCAVQNIAVINGKPGLYGPAMLAVVQASGLLADIDEGVEGQGETRHAYCIVTRRGGRPRTFTFSMADARKARLTSKSGPWQDFPDRMLLARARSFALRDTFPDVLMGLAHSVEELRDIPAEPPREPPRRPLSRFPEGTAAAGQGVPEAMRQQAGEPVADMGDAAMFEEADPETGEVPPLADRARSAVGQGDDTARRMAERRGAAAANDEDESPA